MIRRLLLGFIAALFLFDGMISNSQAAVEGNSYAVTVQTNFTGTFQDVLTFNPDGSLTAQSGAAGGQWTESGQRVISSWQGNLSTISLTGTQVGPLLFGTGDDGRGHHYMLIGRLVR